jgi:hypothetical protein
MIDVTRKPSGRRLIEPVIAGLGGRVLGCTKAKKSAGLVAWHELAHGWDVGQHFRAHRGGHRKLG